MVMVVLSMGGNHPFVLKAFLRRGCSMLRTVTKTHQCHWLLSIYFTHPTGNLNLITFSTCQILCLKWTSLYFSSLPSVLKHVSKVITVYFSDVTVDGEWSFFINWKQTSGQYCRWIGVIVKYLINSLTFWRGGIDLSSRKTLSDPSCSAKLNAWFRNGYWPDTWTSQISVRPHTHTHKKKFSSGWGQVWGWSTDNAQIYEHKRSQVISVMTNTLFQEQHNLA